MAESPSEVPATTGPVGPTDSITCEWCDGLVLAQDDRVVSMHGRYIWHNGCAEQLAEILDLASYQKGSVDG